MCSAGEERELQWETGQEENAWTGMYRMGRGVKRRSKSEASST